MREQTGLGRKLDRIQQLAMMQAKKGDWNPDGNLAGDDD